MSFTDPQSLTINGATTSLPRVGSGPSSGSFKTPDGNVELSVSHNYGKRYRRTVRVNQSKIASDPFVAGASGKVSMSVYMVVDAPVNGFTAAEQKYLVDALSGYLAAGSGAKAAQLLGGEN